jgi:hypothetical protein
MVGIDRIGEGRELRQVTQLGDTFRSGHQLATGLPPHALAGLMEFPDSSFLLFAVVHRVTLSHSGAHRAGDAGTAGRAGVPQGTTSDSDLRSLPSLSSKHEVGHRPDNVDEHDHAEGLYDLFYSCNCRK